MSYLGPASDSLAGELRKLGYQAAFYPVTQVSNLSNLKDPIPRMEKSGVCRIQCPCGDQYVGQSRRTFTRRFREHELVFEKLIKSIPTDKYSAVARHCYDEGHPFAHVILSGLHQCTDGRKLDRLEEYYTLLAIQESARSNHNILNDVDSVFFNHFILFILDYSPSIQFTTRSNL